MIGGCGHTHQDKFRDSQRNRSPFAVSPAVETAAVLQARGLQCMCVLWHVKARVSKGAQRCDQKGGGRGGRDKSVVQPPANSERKVQNEKGTDLMHLEHCCIISVPRPRISYVSGVRKRDGKE